MARFGPHFGKNRCPVGWGGVGAHRHQLYHGLAGGGVLALIAYHMREPLVVVVGEPVTYGLSHLVLLAGSWLAGTRYALIIFRWATRWVVEKLGGPMAPPMIS